MPIQGIQANGPQPAAVEKSKSPLARVEKTLDTSAGAEASRMWEQLDLTGHVGATRASEIVLERILDRIEVETPGARDIFEAAGKGEFMAGAIGPEVDTSPQATAGRIIGGITGYIYGAFKSANPDMTTEDLTRFQAQVSEGFEKGIEDAKDILAGLQSLSSEREEEIDRTVSIVRTELENFFESAMNRLENGEAKPLIAPS